MKTIDPSLPANTHVVFKGIQKTKLKETLIREVDEYFARTGLQKTGTYALYLKTLIFFTLLIVLYLGIIYSKSNLLSFTLLYPLLGLVFAGIGFNTMHDSAHGSYSQIKWLNELLGYSLNIVGGNVKFWKQKHNIAHHSYTNIIHHEEDIDITGMRVHKDQEWKPIHKHQHKYWVIFYSLSYILWIFVSDFTKYFSGKIHVAANAKIHLSLWEHIIFWSSKIIYLSVFIGIPWYTHGILYALTGFVIMSLVCGFVISTIFQLAHIVESTDNVKAENGIVENEWVTHQLNTTSDFATKSSLLSWLVGGLNFQVEHHLFPKISHVHYPALRPIVKRVAEKFGVKHNEEPTLWSALQSHVRVLKKLGQKPSVS